jgi:ADP-ribosyl-[dinitrogen reductase] hydrolase
MHLTPQQTDRAVGSLLGAAVGDALGVPYEYGSRPLDPVPAMHGGGLGNAAPGEWSDDTAMAVCIAEVAATGADLRTPEALGEVAARFLRWYDDDPPDIGIQTRKVPGETRRRLRDRNGAGAAIVMREVAADLHARTGRTAGNGSLMRTAPVALAHLGDPDAITQAARAVSALTHADPVAGDACVLWCLAIDLAVRTGRLDVRVGLDRVDPMWGPLLDEAERSTPPHYSASNGWVVAALGGAWSAVSRSTSYADGVVRAVAGGGDTDTVAAIAGALLGAAYGGSAVPAAWRRPLHGWPGLRARDLVRLAVLAARRGRPDRAGWPSGATVAYSAASAAVVPHPDDPGVLLAGVGALRPGVADAVVSLCRLGTAQVPATATPATTSSSGSSTTRTPTSTRRRCCSTPRRPCGTCGRRTRPSSSTACTRTPARRWSRPPTARWSRARPLGPRWSGWRPCCRPRRPGGPSPGRWWSAWTRESGLVALLLEDSDQLH